MFRPVKCIIKGVLSTLYGEAEQWPTTYIHTTKKKQQNKQLIIIINLIIKKKRVVEIIIYIKIRRYDDDVVGESS